MKRILASIALAGLLTLGAANLAFAQDATAAPADTAATATPTEEIVATVEEPAQEMAPVVEEGGFHQALKTKFIEGGPEFMAAIAIVLILGLAFCLERIIYLNLADVNNEKFLAEIDQKLQANKVSEALELARDTRGPVASITYQAITRLDQGLEAVERSITAYGGVQAGLLEKNMSWITLFIATAPSLGFLGTVVGMVMAFDTIEQVGDISPTVVAGGMKVALITTIFGLIVAMILQVFYNYILAKYEGIINKMEDSSITLVDSVVAHQEKYGNK
ncbi:MAG: MotA/TolQ/ExbB proton channel family protein [Bacteroidales bacterium]|uniref:MotA/TolQ/ExbB proton channel family protein n=1 Tax=Porphyromonas sp. TaxID=1924944 RepID=UPI00297546AE|nr:MotA/TolQ/ExbB proton channel family protein [Porphyromonas sp.]MDD7438218.1 MotA/TolQ/ExbB proton channel family protein [Bacteroidales bacterium]MDY3067055.1 MotA/TolQ/ExbB proton channel family protein [Porphyromonas sp.]